MRNRGQHWGQYTAQCIGIVWIDVYSMIRIVKNIRISSSCSGRDCRDRVRWLVWAWVKVPSGGCECPPVWTLECWGVVVDFPFRHGDYPKYNISWYYTLLNQSAPYLSLCVSIYAFILVVGGHWARVKDCEYNWIGNCCCCWYNINVVSYWYVINVIVIFMTTTMSLTIHITIHITQYYYYICCSYICYYCYFCY